jgi:uncharacterized protein YceK
MGFRSKEKTEEMRAAYRAHLDGEDTPDRNHGGVRLPPINPDSLTQRTLACAFSTLWLIDLPASFVADTVLLPWSVAGALLDAQDKSNKRAGE